MPDYKQPLPTPPRKPLVMLTGTGATGKTSLARLLAAEFGVPLVGSCGREVQRRHGIIGSEDDQWRMTGEERWAMQQDISRTTNDRLRAAIEAGDGFVSDRSALDHLCYAIWKSHALASREWIEGYEREAREIMAGVDVVIFCGMQFELPDDGDMRTTDWTERCLQDRLIQGYIEHWRDNHGNPPWNVIRLSRKSAEIRCREVVPIVARMLDEEAAAIAALPAGLDG